MFVMNRKFMTEHICLLNISNDIHLKDSSYLYNCLFRCCTSDRLSIWKLFEEEKRKGKLYNNKLLKKFILCQYFIVLKLL